MIYTIGCITVTLVGLYVGLELFYAFAPIVAKWLEPKK